VEFFKLSRAVQDRFIGSTRGAIPAPILVAPVRPRAPMVWWFLGGLATLAEVVAATLGYGKLANPSAIQGSHWLATHVVLLGVAVFCIAWGLGLQQRYVALPYRPWIYLFPGSLVDARTPVFRVIPITELQDVRLDGTSLSVKAREGGSFLFPRSTPESHKEVLAAIEAAKYRLRDATEGATRGDVAGFDPLADTGYTNPFSPETAIRPPRGLPLAVALLVGVAIGGVLGAAVWKVRNEGSESAIFGAAVRAGTPQAFRQYLARGGKRPEVASHLLPRAELVAARATGTLQALDDFAARHPDTPIRAEVDAVYREFMLTELERARSEGTLAALAGFERNHARTALVAPELAAARHAIYQRVLADFDARPATPAAKAFLARLLAYAETAGSHATLRFRRRLAASTKEIEVAVMTNEYYTSAKQLPRNTLSEEQARRREALAAPALLQALQRAIPSEILSFQLGAPVAEDAELGEVTEPTLFVDRKLVLSGLYPKKEPRGVYVGVETTFQAQLLLPGDDAPLTLTLTTLRQPPLKLLETEGAQPMDVYDRMIMESFEKLAAALATLLGVPATP